MLSRTDSADGVNGDVFHNERRSRIHRSAWLDYLRYLFCESEGKILCAYLSVSFYDLNSLEVVENGLGIFVYLFSECFKISSPYGKSCGELMSAVFFKKLGALGKCGNKIKAFDARPDPFPRSTGDSSENAGTLPSNEIRIEGKP